MMNDIFATQMRLDRKGKGGLTRFKDQRLEEVLIKIMAHLLPYNEDSAIEFIEHIRNRMYYISKHSWNKAVSYAVCTSKMGWYSIHVRVLPKSKTIFVHTWVDEKKWGTSFNLSLVAYNDKMIRVTDGTDMVLMEKVLSAKETAAVHASDLFDLLLKKYPAMIL